MDLLTRLRSPYLLGLVGYCSDNDHRLLVYEYMANGGLQEHLYPNGGMQILDGSSACCSQCLLSLRDGIFSLVLLLIGAALFRRFSFSVSRLQLRLSHAFAYGMFVPFY